MNFPYKLLLKATSKFHALRFVPHSLPALYGPLPASVDYRPQMTPIKNQQNEGCCTGEGTTALTEFYFKLSTWLAEAYLYAKVRQAEGTFPADAGASCGDIMMCAHVDGCPPEADLPFEDNAAEAPTAQSDEDAAQYRIPMPLRVVTDDDGTAMRTNLAAGKVVNIAIQFPDNWMQPGAGGLMPTPSGNSAGGHDVCVVGYQFDSSGNLQLIVRNSWGEGWGAAGYFIPLWSDISPLMDEAYTC